jgi:NitT/TauT family transport system ATP-binding protein
VFENAAFGLRVQRTPAAQIRDRVSRYLEVVGLTRFADSYPYQLSGGMQQRVGLARALAIDPSILLMDEPFAALDAQTREILQEELVTLMQRPGERKAMVFITHSIDEALIMGDRIAVMSARPGRVIEMIDVPFSWPRDVEEIRASPVFADLRRHIWGLLRNPNQRSNRSSEIA